jgi:hypothetical protein
MRVPSGDHDAPVLARHGGRALPHRRRSRRSPCCRRGGYRGRAGCRRAVAAVGRRPCRRSPAAAGRCRRTDTPDRRVDPARRGPRLGPCRPGLTLGRSVPWVRSGRPRPPGVDDPYPVRMVREPLPALATDELPPPGAVALAIHTSIQRTGVPSTGCG